MPVSPAEVDYLRLTYRPDLRILFMRWTRLVSSAEHKAGYAAALAFAQPPQASRWLIDLRIRGLADADDFTWVLTDFRRQMQLALPQASFRVAYLVTPNHKEVIDGRLTVQEATFRTFIEEQPAYAWLGGL